jgi:hypothetical protein
MFKKIHSIPQDQTHRLPKHVLDGLNTAPEDDVLFMPMNLIPDIHGAFLQCKINSKDLVITCPIQMMSQLMPIILQPFV